MKYAFFLIFLCFTLPGSCREAIGVPPGFSIEMTLSSNTIDLDQQMNLDMVLNYPSGYYPNIDLIRMGLVENAGLYEPPFAITKDEVHPPQETKGILTQQINFTLSPQTIGEHYLSAGLVRFDPNSKEGKKVIISSDVFTINVSSPEVDVNLHSLIEPPLPISLELPIALSQANRMAFINNPHLLDEEAQQNESFIKSKAFPWLALISALAVMLVITFTRLLPAKAVRYEADPLIKEKNEAQIKKELQRLTSSEPKDAEGIDAFIRHLDFLLRRFLLNRYGFPAFSFTAQELENEINHREELSGAVREGMAETFRAADQVKFGRHVPSQDEVGRLMDTAKQLLS